MRYYKQSDLKYYFTDYVPYINTLLWHQLKIQDVNCEMLGKQRSIHDTYVRSNGTGEHTKIFGQIINYCLLCVDM